MILNTKHTADKIVISTLRNSTRYTIYALRLFRPGAKYATDIMSYVLVFTLFPVYFSCKRIICNQVCRRTVARTGDVLNNTTVNVHRCQNSHLYLLAPLRSVVIEKCHDSTIVLGCVDTVLVVVACDKVKIVAPCKRIIIV